MSDHDIEYRKEGADQEILIPKAFWSPGIMSTNRSKSQARLSNLIVIVIAVSSLLLGITLTNVVNYYLNITGITQPVDSLSPKSTVPQTFSKHPIFSDAPNSASNDAWSGLIPKGRGFVKIDGTTTVPYSESLQQTTISANGSIFCLSVFHQLHCLDMLRRGYYRLAASAKGEDVPDQAADMPNEHMTHCFDYLRQGIMCASDTTLEPRDVQHSGVQGWGVTHQCRNFDSVKNWAETWRSNDNGGITN